MSAHLASRGCDIIHDRTTDRLRAEVGVLPEDERVHVVGQTVHGFMSSIDSLRILTPEEFREVAADLRLALRQVDRMFVRMGAVS